MSYGFSRGQTSDKISLYKKSRSSLFILNNRKKQIFYLKDDIHNGKLWVEVIITVIFLGAVHVATVDVLTANNKDVKLGKTQTVHLACLLNPHHILREKTNITGIWQILALICPLKYHGTLHFSNQSYSACKDGECNEKGLL